MRLLSHTVDYILIHSVSLTKYQLYVKSDDRINKRMTSKIQPQPELSKNMSNHINVLPIWYIHIHATGNYVYILTFKLLEFFPCPYFILIPLEWYQRISGVFGPPPASTITPTISQLTEL